MASPPKTKKALSVYVPSNLTHYTNLNGLTGIVDTGELWASNASFLNDRRELIHGLEASVEAVQRLASKAYRSWKPVLDDVVNDLSHGEISTAPISLPTGGQRRRHRGRPSESHSKPSSRTSRGGMMRSMAWRKLSFIKARSTISAVSLSQ
jgi:hypothetical protein